MMPTFVTGVAPGYAGAPAYRTHSIPGPFNAGVVFERNMDLSPPRNDEIIIAPIRVRSAFRRSSVEEGAALPERPSKRNFVSRLSSRIANSPSPGSHDNYKAIKMPRRDYKRYFARDRLGNYAGTEPEREWDEADLQREFGMYQEMALRSVPGPSEYGEGDRRGSGARNGSVDGDCAGRNESVDGDEGVSGKDLERKGSAKSDEEWWL